MHIGTLSKQQPYQEEVFCILCEIGSSTSSDKVCERARKRGEWLVVDNKDRSWRSFSGQLGHFIERPQGRVRGLTRYSVHWTETALSKLFHNFWYMLDLQPKAEQTTMDPAFQWYRLFDLFVCSEKVDNIVFLGAVKSNRPSSHAYYSYI